MEKIKDMLQSSRFWAVLIGAVMIYLQSKGFIGESEMMLVNTILAGYIGIKTVQHFQ